MQLPPIPENEAERLRELRKYSFLSTLPEKDLDDLTQLASEICNAPIALIGLIDEERQWYKSKVGIGGDGVPRELSFCTHTLSRPSEILEISDSRIDSRFKDYPSVTGEPYVVFYAGVPLVSSGFALGTLCVIDNKPKKLNDSQLNALRILAKQIINQFELRKSILLLKETETRLNESNEEMKAFTYSISHDLRTPLRSINSYASILLEEYLHNMDEEAQRITNRIGSEAKRMGSLIDDLLTLSRVSQSPLNVREIDMTALARRVFERLTALSDQSRIDFTIDVLPTAKADYALMELVWQNLIENAIKYSAKKDKAVIEIGSRKEDNREVYFIRDNGAGFDMKYVHKLFGVFERLYGLNEFEGTGVGLAITKRILDRHGAKVWAEGVLGGGATFFFAFTDSSRVDAVIAS